MNAIVIQHNFIEAHTTINEISCEKAGVKLVLSENRWLDLGLPCGQTSITGEAVS